MTLRAFEFGNPLNVYERKQFFERGCAACACHKPKHDKNEYHCAAGMPQWPEATQQTCKMFSRKIKKRADK